MAASSPEGPLMSNTIKRWLSSASSRAATAVGITSVYDSSRKHAFASVARMVKVEVPAVVGVPASTPAAVRVMPAGSAPVVTPNLYGAVPPLAVSVVL